MLDLPQTPGGMTESRLLLLVDVNAETAYPAVSQNLGIEVHRFLCRGRAGAWLVEYALAPDVPTSCNRLPRAQTHRPWRWRHREAIMPVWLGTGVKLPTLSVGFGSCIGATG